LSNTESSAMLLAGLQFRLRRQLQLLRRARASIRERGWKATWRRACPQEGDGFRAAPASLATAEDPHRDGGPWVLVVDGRAPQPDRDSGSLRLLNLMRAMVSAGYRVAFIADEGAIDSASVARLSLQGILVPAPAGIGSALGWLGAHRGTLAAAIVCRHHAAGHWLPMLRRIAPRARLVFDTVDLHYLRESREAELQGDRGLARRAAATRNRETALAALADTTWVVSPVERELLLHALPGADVRVVSNIIEDDTAGAAFEQRHGLLFVGGLRHPPNRDAVMWLVSDIFPRIRAELPGVELHLAGDPGHDAAAVPVAAGVVAHGHVPDLVPLLDGCRIAVAPLRFGAGVKGKINLSQAHGQPVVATACAVEGMHLEDGGDVLVADDAAGFAARVVRLYRDADLWRTLAENGRANVRRHFSPEAALDTVRASLGPPGGQH